jgi:PAS domain S-box-containing protein
LSFVIELPIALVTKFFGAPILSINAPDNVLSKRRPVREKFQSCLIVIELFESDWDIDGSELRLVFLHAPKSPDRKKPRDCQRGHSMAAIASTLVYDLPAPAFSAGTVARMRGDLDTVTDATAFVCRGRRSQSVGETPTGQMRTTSEFASGRNRVYNARGSRMLRDRDRPGTWMSLTLTSPDFKTLFEAVPGMYLVFDPELRIVAVNDAYARAAKLRREDMIGKSVFELVRNNGDVPATFGMRDMEASLQRILLDRTGDAMAVQRHDIRKPDDEGGGLDERFWSYFNSPVFAADGSLAWIIHRVEDVTESVRIKAEGADQRNLTEALKESEERLRLVLQASAIGTFEIDVVSGAGHWNTIEYELLGLEPGRARAEPQTFFRFVHSDDVAKLNAEWHEAIRTGTLNTEFRVVRADGSERWLAGKGQFAFEDKGREDAPEARGRASRFLGVNFDITDRKQAEIELRNSERRERERAAELAAVFDAVPTPVFIAHDPDCLHITGNRAADDLLRHPRGAEASLSAPEETKPRHFRAWKDGRELSTDELPAQRAARGCAVEGFEFTLVFDDGTSREMLSYATPLWDDAGQPRGAINVLVDITELKRAQEALRDRNARLASVLNAAADAIITIDLRGTIQSVNAAALEMFGYTDTEMIGQNVNMLMPSPYFEQHDRYLSAYTETGEKRVIGVGREVVGRRKDGSTFPVDLAVSEVEHLKLYTGLLRDISRRKELEREVVEIASLEQRRIGQDLHDTLSQELAALNMTADDLSESLRTNPADGAILVDRIIQGLRRSRQQLRAVMKGLLPVEIDDDGLMTALSDLAVRTEQTGTVTCIFDCPDPVVVGDNLIATHLFLIAQEAIHNAIKHAHARTIHVSVQAGEALVLRVHDDGTGITSLANENHRGMGLRIMRNRAAIISATLTIEPAKPTGTLLTCALARKINDP